MNDDECMHAQHMFVWCTPASVAFVSCVVDNQHLHLQYNVMQTFLQIHPRCFGLPTKDVGRNTADKIIAGNPLYF